MPIKNGLDNQDGTIVVNAGSNIYWENNNERTYTTIRNGTVDFSNSKGPYMSSQKSYASAKEYAEKVLQELKGFNELELERRAKSVIAKCNYNK